MTKSELIYAIANKADVSKISVDKVLATFIEVIGDEMQKGEKVSIAGFGSFETTIRAARSGRNPATGEPMQISESKSVKFKAAKNLKDRVK